jgi:hypothetical protein
MGCRHGESSKLICTFDAGCEEDQTVVLFRFIPRKELLSWRCGIASVSEGQIMAACCVSPGSVRNPALKRKL